MSKPGANCERAHIKTVILIGVAGSGKSTIGMELARTIGGSFFEGDDFHPAPNICKMKNGIPLTDADRYPWLKSIHEHICSQSPHSKLCIYSCSALKQAYRDVLQGGLHNLGFIFLNGDYNLIRERMVARSGHFFGEGLLHSQFEDLEVPSTAFHVDANQDISAIVAQIVSFIGPSNERSVLRDS